MGRIFWVSRSIFLVSFWYLFAIFCYLFISFYFFFTGLAILSQFYRFLRSKSQLAIISQFIPLAILSQHSSNSFAAWCHLRFYRNRICLRSYRSDSGIYQPLRSDRKSNCKGWYCIFFPNSGAKARLSEWQKDFKIAIGKLTPAPPISHHVVAQPYLLMSSSSSNNGSTASFADPIADCAHQKKIQRLEYCEPFHNTPRRQ